MTFNVYNPSQLDALLGIWNWYQIPKIAQFFYVKKRRFILLFRNYFIPKKKRKYHKRRRHVFYHDGSTEYTWDSSFCRCQNSEMQNSFSLKWCQTTVSIFFILEIKRFLKIFLYYFTWLHINILFYNFLQRRMLRKSTSETATTLKVCLLRITCRKIKDITGLFLNIALCNCLPQWCRCSAGWKFHWRTEQISLQAGSSRNAKRGSTGFLRLILAATPPSSLTTKINLQIRKRLFPVNFHS